MAAAQDTRYMDFLTRLDVAEPAALAVAEVVAAKAAMGVAAALAAAAAAARLVSSLWTPVESG